MLKVFLSTQPCEIAMIRERKAACAHLMSAEPKLDLQLEIAHLLLIDVVGYSRLLVNEQIELLHELNRINLDSRVKKPIVT